MKRIAAFLLCCLLLPLPGLAAGGLSPGSTGDQVFSLQSRLIELFLMTGEADGIYGDKTAAAVTEAQRLLRLAGYDVAETGTADDETLGLLFDEAARDALTTLRLGSKGPRVRELQTRLADLKLLDGGADGAFGSATEAAVKRFQSELSRLGAPGITVTGAANGATQALLVSDLSKYGFRAPIYFDFSDPLGLTEEYLYAKSCILVDAPTGQVYYEQNARERMYPASITKIMTLLVSLERGGLDETVTVPQTAADIPEDSSLVPVTPGETMKKRELLYGLMIRSGNDAANAIATLDAGSVQSFVNLMNQKAAQLGMSGTHFANPHGYHDPEHYTTAADMAALTRAGLTDPDFCQIVTCLQYTLPATEKREPLLLQSTHEIFDPSSPYYLPYAAGVKSGYTSAAGFCYVGAAQKNGRTLIAVVMNVSSRNRAWMDLKKLFEYGFAK